MSRTLEAILSKSDADDDLSVPPAGHMGGVGTKTLLGIGVSGLPLPPRPPALPPKPSDDDHTFSVEDVFDDEGTAVSSVQSNGKGRAAKGGDDHDQVGDLLDEVAEALNVQAASQDSTVGALPGMPVPPARSIRTDVAPSKRGDDGDEFEFEDPDDGPTTLNALGEAASEDVDIGTDDDDEAVVLGPAKLPGARPMPALPGRLPPPPAAVVGLGPPADVKRATPFAGLPAATLPSFPAPVSGRSRLPTPAPGQALGLPPPGGGRMGLPGGTPVNGVPEVPAQAESSRRSSSGRAAGAERSVGHHATAAVMESLSSAVESASVVLKKDVKFRVASLAGVVLGTFVVGLLIGRAVIGSGKKTTAVASEVAAATDEAKAPPAAPKAPAEEPPPAAPSAGTRVAAAPAAPPPPVAAEAAPPVAPPVAEAAPPPAPIHKRRARHATLVAKEDSLPKASIGKSSGPAPKAAAKAAPAAPAAKATPKKKSTWHDPFAD